MIWCEDCENKCKEVVANACDRGDCFKPKKKVEEKKEEFLFDTVEQAREFSKKLYKQCLSKTTCNTSNGSDIDKCAECEVNFMKENNVIRSSQLHLLVEEAEEAWKTYCYETKENSSNETLHKIYIAMQALKEDHVEFKEEKK